MAVYLVTAMAAFRDVDAARTFVIGVPAAPDAIVNHVSALALEDGALESVLLSAMRSSTAPAN